MPRTRAFTILEVALVVAIIGMMLMMIIGYLLAPKEKGPLPPVAARPPLFSSPAPSTPIPPAAVTPTPEASTPPPSAVFAPPVPATPAPATQTIDLSPESSPTFR
ncbi:MAG: hypothetical protein WDN28_11365 [Chthoniobacter sp.]